MARAMASRGASEQRTPARDTNCSIHLIVVFVIIVAVAAGLKSTAE